MRDHDMDHRMKNVLSMQEEAELDLKRTEQFQRQEVMAEIIADKLAEKLRKKDK